MTTPRTVFRVSWPQHTPDRQTIRPMAEDYPDEPAALARAAELIAQGFHHAVVWEAPDVAEACEAGPGAAVVGAVAPGATDDLNGAEIGAQIGGAA